MAFPTPVLVDHVSGMRIHLMRFAVWTPLSFLMTFLTEAIDLNWQSKASAHESFQQHSYQVAWWHAGFMALSTTAGGLFPFTENLFVWWEIMGISWLFYASIYVRLYQRYQRYKILEKQQRQQVPNKSQQTRGPNFLLNEAVDRARMSFQLICMCSITWTLIAGNFTICCFLPNWVAKDSMWASPELQYVIGTMLEATSKVYYLTMQLHVYDRVFDESARSARRLEEMRTLMSALWEASSKSTSAQFFLFFWGQVANISFFLFTFYLQQLIFWLFVPRRIHLFMPWSAPMHFSSQKWNWRSFATVVEVILPQCWKFPSMITLLSAFR